MLLLYVLLFLALIPTVAFFLSEAFIGLGIGLAIAVHWMMNTPGAGLYPLLLVPLLAILGFLVQRRRDAHRQSHRLHRGNRIHL